MLKFKILLKYWLPVVLWMAIIFAASSDPKSFEHSSRILAPVLHWLFPHAPENTINLLVFIARKCAHLMEYAVLALLLWRALRKPSGNDARLWNWNEAGVVLLIVFLYAAGDEFHQIFVATRTPRIHDVVIDTLGGAMALLAVWLVGFRKKRLGKT